MTRDVVTQRSEILWVLSYRRMLAVMSGGGGGVKKRHVGVDMFL